MTNDERALVWLRGIDSEVAFWRNQLGRELENPAPELKEKWRRNIPKDFKYSHLVASGDSVLDVGSGPLTILGKLLPDGGAIELTATDPLAPLYNTLFEMHGIQPITRTQFCLGENLARKFAPNTFHLVHARNSLDHAMNPMQIIRQMIHVCRIGGYVVLEHGENEAKRASYGGLHQWNFQVREGKLALWNRNETIIVNEELNGCAEVACESVDGGSQSFVTATIRKLRDIDFDPVVVIEYEETAYTVLFGSLLRGENLKSFRKTAYRRYLSLKENKPERSVLPFRKKVLREIVRPFKKFLAK